jgi:hypothetical protein
VLAEGQGLAAARSALEAAYRQVRGVMVVVGVVVLVVWGWPVARGLTCEGRGLSIGHLHRSRGPAAGVWLGGVRTMSSVC